VAKLAYSNGGGYLPTGLPSATLYDGAFIVGYLIKDLIRAANKAQGAATAGVYSQNGINIAKLKVDDAVLYTAEIGSDLLITGGFTWSYDGFEPVEQGFHVWPDSIELTASNGAGALTPQQYYYKVTYEWTDNQGNIFRSAPSVPVGVNLAGPNDTVTVHIPTLRLTAKTTSSVNIVVYRWSAAQQTYYQVTSISSPTLNNTAVDSINFVDLLPDSSIIGNSILYTEGGIAENIGAPAFDAVSLFKSRLFGILSENPNTLWYSKQVIQGTPVDMSDLFTIYVAPTIGAQGSTGYVKAMSALDDKLVLFKRNAIYYVTGDGPNDTGNDVSGAFSEPIFVTATVGCENQNSIVFMPQGLMFQSSKGIWLLDRTLNTTYIGADVEDATTGSLVVSASNIPNSNEVRFTMDSGVTLVYNYYFGQWSTFTNIPAIDSTIYDNLLTFINDRGEVYQESPGLYLDGSRPVLMRFTTGWLNLGGLQGFERAYEFYLLGTYISPHKLVLSIAYDYNSSPTQSTIITPDNYAGFYGDAALYGSNSPYGGQSQLEQWRVFLKQQKCQAFQITLQEQFDPSINTMPAGEGLSLSGINLTVGVKDSKPRLRASRQVG
jgi:hypothetical protein